MSVVAPKTKNIIIPGLKPHFFTHQSEILPRKVPPWTGSEPSFFNNSGPPHASTSFSSHLCVSTSMRFIPLASETSIGAILPRNSEGINDETNDMCAVLS